MWRHALNDERRRTPFLALDHERLVANIGDMATRVKSYGGRSTPHQKTHKCAEIGRLQREMGAERATVATPAEAELAFEAGFASVLVAYPPVPRSRADDLVGLLTLGEVAVACSTPEQVQALNETGAPFEIYWEIDSGTGRLGTQPGPATAAVVSATKFTARTPLRGLMTFAGHAYAATTDEELQATGRQQDAALADSVAALSSNDFDTFALSVGVTPLARFESGTAGEYRYGNYVFYDATQVALGGPRLNDCALAVVATVIDAPSETRIVIDAGAKSLPAEQMTSATNGYGVVLDHPEITVAKLYEEHGLCTSNAPHGLRAGDRVAVIPNHACTAVNLYAEYSVFDASGRSDTWRILGRRR